MSETAPALDYKSPSQPIETGVFNAFVRHFIQSTDLAVLVLDAELKARIINPSMREAFSLTENDLGRSVGSIISGTDRDRIVDDVRLVLERGVPVQRMVVGPDGTKSRSMRILPLMTEAGSIDGVSVIFSDLSKLQNTEIALKVQTERLQLAIEAAGLGIWEYDPDTEENLVDDTIRQLYGVQPGEAATVERLFSAIDPDHRERVNQSLEEAANGGEIYRQMFDVIHPDGSRRTLQGVGKLLTTTQADRRLVGINVDVTAQQNAIRTRDLLIQEMNHRVKNLFSVISSMVSLSQKDASSADALAKRLKSQIRALGAAHDISYNVRLGDEGISLHSMLERTLAPFLSLDEIKLRGEEIVISVDALTPLSLILHEWSTNAVKYGVLADRSGTLSLNWFIRASEVEQFIFEWEEQGANPLSRPLDATPGFGSRLIHLSARQLGGIVETDWKPKGVKHRLVVPFEAIRHEQRPA